MITKYGEASKWARNLLENDAGLSVGDFEEYAYGTQGPNRHHSYISLGQIKKSIEKANKVIITVREGYYSVARKHDEDKAQSEMNKRGTLSLGNISSYRRGAEAIYKNFPKLKSEMKIALLELVGKAKDLEILMLKEGKE